MTRGLDALAAKGIEARSDVEARARLDDRGMGELGRACGLTYDETNQIKQAAHNYCATLARVWSALASSMVPFRCCLRGDNDYVYRLDPDLSARNERIEVLLTVPIAPAFCLSIDDH